MVRNLGLFLHLFGRTQGILRLFQRLCGMLMAQWFVYQRQFHFWHSVSFLDLIKYSFWSDPFIRRIKRRSSNKTRRQIFHFFSIHIHKCNKRKSTAWFRFVWIGKLKFMLLSEENVKFWLWIFVDKHFLDLLWLWYMYVWGADKSKSFIFA